MSFLTVRAKLVIGYLINMLLLVIIFFYGYLALKAVGQNNEIIQYSTKALRSSDLVAKKLLNTRVDEKNFLITNREVYANKIRHYLNDLKEEAKRLMKQNQSFNLPDLTSSTQAMLSGIHSYENNFSRLEFLIQRRGNSPESGFKGDLLKLRSSFKSKLSDVIYYKITSIEYQYLHDYLHEDSEKYLSLMRNLIQDAGKIEISRKVRNDLFRYETAFRKLVFLDEEIRDHIRLLAQSAELIEIFLDDRIQVSESVQERQSLLFDKLINQRYTTMLILGLGTVLIAWIVIYTFGTEPLSLSKLLQEQDAILEAINDGIMAVDGKGNIKVINQSARDVFNIKKDIIGVNIKEVIADTRLPDVMRTGVAEYDQELKVNGISIIATRVPVKFRNRIIGGVSSFRKKEDVSRLARELTQVRQYTDALRANKHEYQNRLQTIYGMLQLKHFDEVIEYIDHLQNAPEFKVSLFVDQIHETGISAILLGKFNEAKEKGVSLILDEHSSLDPLPDAVNAHSLITILGNLVQNAIEAVVHNPPGERSVLVFITESYKEIFLKVTDNGGGIDAGIAGRIFEKGFSTKAGETNGYTMHMESGNMGMGLYITGNEVTRLNGKIQYRVNESKTTFEVVIPKKFS